MAGRETRIPKGLVPHRRSGIHRGFSYIAHNRRNVRFKGLWRDTHHPIPEPRTQRLTGRNTGRFRWGCYLYPRTVLCGSETLRGRMAERCTLPLLGLGRVCSRRVQRACGTAMCLCASLFRRRRGPAGLRDLFCFCRNRDLYIRRSWFSACARQGWYHYSRCAPHAAETPGPRLSKRLTCRFLVSPIYICESPRRMQPISASIQIACCWISRGHIACPWLIQA